MSKATLVRGLLDDAGELLSKGRLEANQAINEFPGLTHSATVAKDQIMDSVNKALSRTTSHEEKAAAVRRGFGAVADFFVRGDRDHMGELLHNQSWGTSAARIGGAAVLGAAAIGGTKAVARGIGNSTIGQDALVGGAIVGGAIGLPFLL
jgi:hypothetical protein